MMILPILLASTQSAFDAGPNPLLLQQPTLSSSSIVFQFAGDIWSVPRSGGDAVRLTTFPGTESSPKFSPDGKTIAFTAAYDGNTDVYVIEANGGSPKRITFHPSSDQVLGWTPDGQSIIMGSTMLSNTQAPRMFTVSAKGGVPKALPFPMGTMASMSPDGQQLAYVPGFKWQDGWKRYRGGQAYSIWIGNMSDSKVVEIPRKGWNDQQPMWIGDKVFYLSDPAGPIGLHSYDIKSKKVTAEVPGTGFDIKSASAGPGAIVYAKLGSVHLFDLATRKSTEVKINVRGDFRETRPAFKTVSNNLSGINISPNGQRLIAAARGWIFTIPAAKGDTRVLHEQQGVHRRDPSWSPDGKTIAYITDQSKRQQLALMDVTTNTEKLVDLGESPAYYYAPTWSPDSTKITYYDNRNRVWMHDVATGVNTELDRGTYTDPYVNFTARWSPDSKWITWARDLDSHMQAIFVYSVESGKKTQITDGLSNAKNPIFDRDGKHLYFYASTNTGPALSWLDISSFTNPITTSSVYCVVLRNDLPNPLHPESDEDGPKPTAPATPPATEAPRTGIDLENIEQRIITLPMPEGNYLGLEAGPSGSFFATIAPQGAGPQILKWNMATRSANPFASGSGITTTPDGTKGLLSGAGFQIVNTMAPAAPPGPGVSLANMRVKIDPKAEWRSMFDEIWRNQPMLMYAANYHGLNAEEMRQRYAPFVDGVATRNDLNYLFTDMIGEVSVGHMWAGGGDIPGTPSVGGGLLGADYSFENSKYRITRIYDGERWNPGLYAPLAQPGLNVKVGEYIIAIDGKELLDTGDIYQLLEGRSGRQVKVKIGPNPDGSGSREITVVPVGSEIALRNRAWAEDNRRYVAKMTNGRAGYVHVPDTGGGGWESFTRYYYAQNDKDGIIVDERFNNGGLITDHLIYEMTKTLDAAFTPRDGKDWPTPGAAIYGPKVMLVNEFAGSGGDMFPWLFKHKKIGPVIGKRTWGGLVASFGFGLVDGGNVNAPNCAFYNPASGKWEVEGYGVDPDQVVELDPYLWRQGKDSQLEAAIAEINKQLAKYKRPELKRPANPDKSKVGSGGF
ncbi:hypothetical protein CCB80_09255 [Armatimonadetes bacterium Uphvl-Ar1]|nr:hypothetical protein CCB80_09255 [Armatimonadetes bacterium Uphvl-Ar1]